MLHKAAIETNVIFDRAIDASGHGKKEIDGLNGTDDHYTRRELRGNSEYQPENVKEGKRTVLCFQMEKGKYHDMAEMVRDILSHPSRKDGVQKVPSVKPRSESSSEEHGKRIQSRHYIVRPRGSIGMEGLKMKAVGFPTGSGNGIKFHYNFRFEKVLGEGEMG